MKKFTSLNTYYKLLYLIIGTSFFFFLLYISLYIYTIQQENNVYKSTITQYNNEVKSLFELSSSKNKTTIDDITFWDDLVKYTTTKDKIWFEKHIVNSFESYEVDYIGIYDINKEFISNITTSKVNIKDFIPKGVMVNLNKTKYLKFYMRIPEGIVEVYGATIHPSNDPKKVKSKPSGYFFMARLLDTNYFEYLDRISSSKVKFLGENELAEDEKDMIVTSLNLFDYNKKTVSKLLFKRPFNLNYRNTKDILTIIIIASIFNILIYLYYSKRWVYKPLQLITNILESGNRKSISDLKLASGEFGHIGELFEENDHQKLQLEIAKEKAEESDNLKSTFLANLSHEIRTPMNAIVGFSDLLDNNQLTEEERNYYLKIIINSGNGLVSIIEDLIEMSKIDANQITPNIKGFNLELCLKELYETTKVTIPNGKKINFYIIESLNPISKNILTDETKLKQILINLITNAVKFTDNGFVAFGYNFNEKEGYIEFIVKDSGLGIDQKHLSEIFNRFHRIEEDFSVELGGLGLGLSITKAYVEMLGGSINVESIFKKGSVFSFTIPLIYDNIENKEKTIKTKNSFINNVQQTILVAEDDKINFLLLKKILELKNYIVLRAENGQEAVEICKNNAGIDLVFMDIKMPVMNGYEAFEVIKKLYPNLPVIAQTAHSSIEVKEKVLNSGFTNYITKPLDKERIYELLESIFQNSN
jgi:signal transduction histidine kinase/CheY-like chemotaxis protein